MGQTKEQRSLKQLSGETVQRKTAIASDMFLPNHSGDHSAGIVNSTPTNDTDLPNKKYVDDAIDTDITTHINTAQAHSDYLLNNASDTTTGTLTAAGFTTTGTINLGGVGGANLDYDLVNDTLDITGAVIYDFGGEIHGESLHIDNITINGNQITSSTGTVDFYDDDLTTTGDFKTSTASTESTYNKQWLIDEIARLQLILNEFPK